MNKKSLEWNRMTIGGQLESLLEHFDKKVAKVEALQRVSVLSVCSDIQTPNQYQGTLVRGTSGHPVKLINPPSLPLFSGVDPTPKDEANYKQWLFQTRGALNSHMEEAVCSGIIRSVQGEVREPIGLIGFQADLTDILDCIEERFGKAPTTDKLQHEFYLLGQEKMEKVQQYASNIRTSYSLVCISTYAIPCISSINKKR